MKTILEWDLGVAVFSSYDTDGFLGVQVDADGEGESGVIPYEVHPINGVLHRPVDPAIDPGSARPIPSQSANLLFFMEDGHGQGFVLGDPRTMAWLPLLQKGETILFNDFASFIRLDDEGTVSITTTSTNAPGGQTVSRQTSPTGFDDFGPWGRMQFDAYGFRVNYQPGANFTLGYMGGPTPGLATLASLVADQIEIDGTAITIGSEGSLPGPVVKAMVLLGLLEVMAAALSAAAADITALGSATGTPVSSPPLLTAVLAAIEAAAQPMQTQTLVG